MILEDSSNLDDSVIIKSKFPLVLLSSVKPIINKKLTKSYIKKKEGRGGGRVKKGKKLKACAKRK